MSKANYYSEFMVNEAKFERERDVKWSKDHDATLLGEPRKGWVTGLLTGNKYTMEGGIDAFLETDWSEQLCNVFCSIYEYYEDEEHHTTLPKDRAELGRVARLFRETYIAYFIWHAIKDTQGGYCASIFHYIGEILPDAYFMSEKWDLYDPKTTEEDKVARQLWDVFMDRVYGRSDRFNFTNFVTANSALSMLEEIYYKREAHQPDPAESKQKNLEQELGLLREEKVKREVEAYLNGKDDN